MIARTWKNTGRSSKLRWTSYALGRDALGQTKHFLARLKGVRLPMNVKMAESDADLERISGVLLQLRNSFDRKTLIAQIKQQREAGYRIAYVESDGEILCVAGFVVGIKLAWGKHIYVDDLVTAESHRSKGAGTKMISWLKSHARQLGCNQLHLDSGVQRFSAHRFYLREGFNIGSHHFSIIDLSNDERKRGLRAGAEHSKPDAVETITPMKDEKGIWRVAGYFIK